MTHPHDTSTPAMITEIVPSEEFVLVPCEPTPKMIRAARLCRDDASWASRWGAMIDAAPTLSASHIAKEGGKAEVVDWLWWGRDEADKEHVSFGRWQKHPCQHRYKLAAIQPTEHDHPQHSPAAKGGDAVRSHDVLDEAKINALPLPLIARFAGDKDWLPIHDIGVDAPLCRIDVSGKLEPRRFSEIMELKDGDGVIHNPDDFYLDADTPTEGPASQAEGMGGEVNEAAEREAFEKWWPKHWPNAGSVSDNVWQGWMGRAALTLPETAEAVPVAADPSVWGVYVSSDGRYTNLSSDDEEEARQIGEDNFSFGVEVRPLYTHPDPEAAHLREELKRVTQERDDYLATASHPAPATDDRERLVEAEAVFRKIREYAENIAFSAGVGESEIAGQIVSFLVDRPELLRDFMAGTLSAIDTGMLDHHNGVLSYWGMDGEVHRPDPRQARFPALRAVLATEASR